MAKRRGRSPMPQLATCPRCGEKYELDEVEDTTTFFKNGCGAAMGTVCDGGADALSHYLEAMLG
jgi:hypothetical protein